MPLRVMSLLDGTAVAATAGGSATFTVPKPVSTMVPHAFHAALMISPLCSDAS